MVNNQRRSGSGSVLALLAPFLYGAVAPVLADDAKGSFRLTTGAEYTTGDYGGSKSVEEWYVPVTGKYVTGPYVLRLTVPYLRVTAPGGTAVTGGGRGDVVVPGTGPRQTEEGLGDIIAGTTYRDLLGTEKSDDIAVDLTGKIKFGTADEDKGLGTGENDYTVQIDVFRFIDRWTPYGSLGYRFRGDPPGENLDNGWLGGVGTRYDVSSQLAWSLDWYLRESSVSGADDPSELTGTLSYRLGPTQQLNSYVIKGLSDGSPDWGLGVMLTVRN
jgi:hypothetical protein